MIVGTGQLGEMEEYFVQKCVTADAASAPLEAISTWSTAHRCECVMVQENAQAHGASRAMVASILEMTTASKKTQCVALVTLEPALVGTRVTAHEKLVAIDMTATWSCLEAPETLLSTIQAELDKALPREPDTSLSARPTVVVIDSLNVLLDIYPLARVLSWLRTLRCDPRIGSVIFRLNASAVMTSNAPAVVQALGHETTTVVHVETSSSLRAYPILAKERRRNIPARQHGLVQLLRKKKNGRTSESVEYFHVADGRVTYSADGDTVTAATTPTTAKVETTVLPSTSSRDKALPVAPNDVTFNLSISAEEEAAKRNVELPYMHQGGANDAVNNLLYIDEDDPDWDDDDLDDDLDI